jgi:chorismate dehydratase
VLFCVAKVIELEKIKVGAVSYLNTKPYIWGLTHSSIIEMIDLKIDYPARIAQGLIDGSLDIGLVPVAILPSLPSFHFVCDYGIACDGEVASVALFSQVPLHEIETIHLDFHSRTSVALLKILLDSHWKIKPQLLETQPDKPISIQDKSAALLIGDKALVERSSTKYIYDLGTAWKEFTGLPFVFAAWVSKRKLSDDFIDLFEKACREGVLNIDKSIDELDFSSYRLSDYYKKNIHFLLDENKKKGLNLFMQYLKASV